MTRILVVGDDRDLQTAWQIETLKRLGADVIPMLPTAPEGFAWTHDATTTGMRADGLDFATIDGALVRALPSELLGAHVFDEAGGAIDHDTYWVESCMQRERADAMLSTLLALESAGVPMMNAPSRSLLSRRKPWQLDALRRSGCRVPASIITNDPHALRAFATTSGRAPQECIVKPVAGGALTRLLSDLDDDAIDSVRAAPVIAQERVRGDDLRVMVVDGEVVSCAAIGVPDDTLDFRGNATYANGGACYQDVSLPADVRAACRRAARTLRLRFCGFDIKHLRGSDDWVFLECNNSPIYVDVERKLGHKITERLCSALLDSAGARRSTLGTQEQDQAI